MQTDVRRNYLILIARTLHELYQTVQERDLGSGIFKFLLIRRKVSNAIAGTSLDVNESVASLIVLESPLSSTQFGIDLLKSLIDECFSTPCYLILVFVSLSVITDSQLAQIINTALDILVIELEIQR